MQGNKKIITIEIDTDGNCKAEAHGFHGPECDQIMREIDAALGTRTGTKHKTEYARIAPQHNRVSNSQ